MIFSEYWKTKVLLPWNDCFVVHDTVLYTVARLNFFFFEDGGQTNFSF